ncbi:hypothetical protein niasHT_014003 [Heterodera trifolii]|uniref:14-3-3 domain-containing protein n=1 Tax=Heterodera trifolii TaxID=157864 RepID=A0ABD2KX77_9BILA
MRKSCGGFYGLGIPELRVPCLHTSKLWCPEVQQDSPTNSTTLSRSECTTTTEAQPTRPANPHLTRPHDNLINVCEKARRFDDMVEAMKKLIKLDPNLGLEDRVSLSLAYKGAMSSRRSSWRSLVSIEERTGPEMNERQHQVVSPSTFGGPGTFSVKNATDFSPFSQAQVMQSYREHVQNELVTICQELLTCINEVLFAKATEPEPKVFYLKMKADYYRYMAEVATDEDRSGVVELAKAAYQEAMEIATSKIGAINPTRLGLALNFSVFNFEILKSVDEARKVAQKAIDLAQAEIATLTVPLAEDASINLRMMRENMELWTPEGGSHTKTT